MLKNWHIKYTLARKENPAMDGLFSATIKARTPESAIDSLKSSLPLDFYLFRVNQIAETTAIETPLENLGRHHV